MYSPLSCSSLPAQGGRLLFKHQSLRPVSRSALPHLSCHEERKRGGGGKGQPDEEVFDGMAGAERILRGLVRFGTDSMVERALSNLSFKKS